MVLGELGADYVAFAPAGADAEVRAARRDLLAWWAELFEVPCVAWDVADAGEGRELVLAGADFLACRASGGPALTGAIELLARALGRGGQG